MAWYTNSLTTLRVLIQDMTAPYTYNDDDLITIMCSAASLIAGEITLQYAYIIDTSNLSITPDPYVIRDTGFETLIAYKSACLIGIGDSKKNASNAITVKDAGASINMTGAAVYTLKWSDSVCLQYEKIKQSYQLGQYVIGDSISTPYGGIDSSSYHRRG